MRDQSVNTSSFIHWEIEKRTSSGITEEKCHQKKAGIEGKGLRFAETADIPVHMEKMSNLLINSSLSSVTTIKMEMQQWNKPTLKHGGSFYRDLDIWTGITDISFLRFLINVIWSLSNPELQTDTLSINYIQTVELCVCSLNTVRNDSLSSLS